MSGQSARDLVLTERAARIALAAVAAAAFGVGMLVGLAIGRLR